MFVNIEIDYSRMKHLKLKLSRNLLSEITVLIKQFLILVSIDITLDNNIDKKPY